MRGVAEVMNRASSPVFSSPPFFFLPLTWLKLKTSLLFLFGLCSIRRECFGASLERDVPTRADGGAAHMGSKKSAI